MSRTEPEVLLEDNHLLLLHKPAGMPSQADDSGDQSVQQWGQEYLRVKYNKPGNVFLGIVHRLDRPASGVMVFARTSKAAERLSAQFHSRSVGKVYWVVTTVVPARAAGSLEHYLEQVEGPVVAVRAHARPGPGRKLARLDYRVRATREGMALVEVELETGRKHQIRAQLAAMGCPVVGDLKYGAPSPLPDKSIALHARSLQLEHPVSKEVVRVEAEVPGIWPWAVF